MELNPAHNIIQKLQARVRANKEDPAIDEYAELLFGCALIAEGSALAEPTKFNHALAELMADSI